METEESSVASVPLVIILIILISPIAYHPDYAYHPDGEYDHPDPDGDDHNH